MSIERVTINSLYINRVFNNVIHLSNPDGVLTPQQIADEVRLNWITPFRPYTAHALVWESVLIQRMGQQPLPSPVTIPFVNVDGDGTSQLHHGVICALLGFHTDLAGRKYRGRYYFGPWPWAYTTNDVNNSSGMAALTAIQNALHARFTAGGTGPLALCIWHRATGDSTLVTKIVARTKIGVQRRRNVGVGF